MLQHREQKGRPDEKREAKQRRRTKFGGNGRTKRERKNKWGKTSQRIHIFTVFLPGIRFLLWFEVKCPPLDHVFEHLVTS